MLRVLILAVAALALIPLAGCKPRQKPETPKEYSAPLPVGENALREVPAADLPSFRITPTERAALQAGIKYSLEYLSVKGTQAKFNPDMGITHAQVVRSLTELNKLLATANDDELDRAIRTRFRAFMSVGWNGSGEVLFSGYYTPVLAASWTREGPYQYPVYKEPPQLRGGGVHQQAQWERPDHTLVPCPSYSELESSGALAGQELAWFTEPYDAYNVRVQGSSKILLPDSKVATIGYAGTTGHEYVPISKKLVADGKIPADRVNAQSLRAYFQAHPADLAAYAALNPRGTFFTLVNTQPHGALDKPVTADVSVATNKEIFPPAAPMLVQTTIIGGDGKARPYCALRLDQDTGGAMRAPGRADLYMGVGDEAGLRAGGQWHEGRMWYLILKD